MSVFDDKAAEVAADISGDTTHPVVFDPATIAAIIGILIQVVKLYQECKKTPEETQVAMTDPGWWNRWRLQRMVRRNMRGHEATDKVYETLLKKGKQVTVEDVTAMFAEA